MSREELKQKLKEMTLKRKRTISYECLYDCIPELYDVYDVEEKGRIELEEFCEIVKEIGEELEKQGYKITWDDLFYDCYFIIEE